ncbi:MAG TPA: SDR family oxidoreductase [Mycobacterium sp.]|jgi:NAD(P)-dependent dehydrogenase (short-subunit alcohol dehydrogenase family)/pimeloyl-ACP methyl ester carboxylesterase
MSLVRSGDIVIAVHEHGNPDGPTVVMVHGWPDSHALWDGVVPLMADRFRVITYDNRGVGQSSSPKAHTQYTMPCLADDFAAVIDAVSPTAPVHVIGHDWGSVAVWEYLARDDAKARVASFTSLSGPSQDHLVTWMFDSFKRPYRLKSFLLALDQALRLSYMALFSVPLLTPGVVRAILGRDAANTLKIYRANYFRSFTGRVRRDHYVDVPVQVIVNTGDPFVRPHSYDALSRWVSRLWRRDIKAGHWSPVSHPHVVAAAVSEMVDVVGGASPSRAMRRAQVGKSSQTFDDTLVSVTGAGSGIGRATALEFARLGAEVVVSDVDEPAVRDTAARIAANGGVAHAYTLDVSDADAVDAFADEVCTAHGLPDIVVNNAGIGQAGRFVDTPAEEWSRVLDVNLGGVVNCCRAFAPRLVERGTGGHIVNVASAAAFAPLQQLNAYCTSKAAVYMFSDCLRAELSSAGVGLTTVCPGPVHTNIVSAARFDVPASPTEKVADRRQRWGKLFAARRYGPEKAAKAIVSAVQKNKPIRPVTPEAYLLYGTSRLAPQALRSTARGQVV